MGRSRIRVLAGLVFCALIVYPLLPDAVSRDLLQTVIIASALALTWKHLVAAPEPVRRSWWTLVVAVTVLGLSDFAAAAEVHLLGSEWTGRLSPYIALAGYAVLGVGVVRWHRRRTRRRSLPGAMEAAIFAIGAVTPLLHFLLLPVLADPAVPVTRKAITVLFGLVDVAGLTLVIRGLLSNEGRSPSLLLHTGALCSALCAASWAGLAGHGQPSPDVGVRVLFLMAFIFFAAGLMHPSVRAASGRMTSYDATPSRRWVWFMGAGQALPLGTLAASWLTKGDAVVDEPVVAVPGLVVTLLLAIRMAGFLRRIGEQADQLAALARSDELTGLHNRRSWNHQLRRACAMAEQRDEGLVVGLLDLDRFKAYNDTRGHLAGDRLLRDAAQAWQRLLGPDEVLARYGGEEFAIALPGATLLDGVARLEELRAVMPDGQTFSAGLALWSAGSDPEVAVAAADDALYRAKAGGRDQVVTAGDTEPEVIASLVAQLRIHLQPILRLADLTVVGVEALSRFAGSDDVARCFADAHVAGYGDRLEVAAIRKALAVPGRPPGVALFVNVSERALRSARFWTELPAALPDVVMELHEGRTGLDDVTLAGYLDLLRARGARIGLDDVGNRPTDLPRMVSLRPDVVKIDRALVTRCHMNPARAEVLRLLTDIAHQRGAEVCVEGVETEEELAVVHATGADLVQGYLFGHPAVGYPVGPPEGTIEMRAGGVDPITAASPAHRQGPPT